MNTYFQIRCKCSKCERTQVVNIDDIINGTKCQVRRLGQPPCNGNISYYTEDPEDARGNALSVLGFINAKKLLNSYPKLAELTDTVVDDLLCWMDQNATPREMGWVDSQGRP